MIKILLIDDDIELTSLLKDLLELEGYQVVTASDGQQGLALLTQEIDLVLLDVMMPVLSGVDTLRALRLQWQTPVLMLTAKGEQVDRIIGLELGADDYLPKPFSDRELLARMRAILRRTAVQPDTLKSSSNKNIIEFQDLKVISSQMEVCCQGKVIDLTGTEIALLLYLIAHAGVILPKSDISLDVLGKKLAQFDRAIDMHISNIRKKLPPRLDGKPRIKTLRGRGYLLVGAE
ncbi:MAG: response regulator [Vibrionaceae bacterium]